MQFEMSDYMRDMRMTRKRPLVQGSREGYCSTPSFASEVSSHTIKNLADALEEAGHATMLSETVMDPDIRNIRKCECQIFDRQNVSCEILQNHEKVDGIMHLVANLSDFGFSIRAFSPCFTIGFI